MIPPENDKIFESELASYWFDENGILYAKSKSTPRTLERQKKNHAFIKQITNNKKVCLLADSTSTSLHDKETRDYLAQELPNVFIAIAVISKSILGYFVTNIFLAIKKQSIPIKFFKSEIEAKNWLKQYL